MKDFAGYLPGSGVASAGLKSTLYSLVGETVPWEGKGFLMM